MSNVIKFRRGKRIPFHRQKPRQRVFCLGCHYMGGDCYQSIQHVCRKRHKHDEWTFVDYSEGYYREFYWYDGFRVDGPNKRNTLGRPTIRTRSLQHGPQG